jgi:D-alanyl-D-alanine dipeptidase
LRQLLVFQNDQYVVAKKNLADYADWLDEQRSEWKIAQSVAKAMKQAKATETFQTKLMHDAALDAVRTGINTAFAQIDSSLMEAQGNQPTISTTPTATPIAKAQSTKELNAPPDLNLDLGSDNTVDAEVIPERRGRK